MFEVHYVVRVEDFVFNQSKEAYAVVVRDEMFKALQKADQLFSEEYDKRKNA